FIFSSCSQKEKAYRGLKYGMTLEEVEKLEEANGSVKNERSSGIIKSSYVSAFWFKMSGKYAEICYSFKNEKLTEIHVLSVCPFLNADYLPQLIKNKYYSPDDFYSDLVDELTALYGNPQIESDKVSWENSYAVIEGSVRDFVQKASVGHYIDENGKETDSIIGRRCDFYFYLK
ncbi:MAG: hypothetical protein II784_00730, partial [Oscillospiraceae bacterium]|nr:hypothetical protein [Oscillospiraceae bacterium]